MRQLLWKQYKSSEMEISNQLSLEIQNKNIMAYQFLTNSSATLTRPGFTAIIHWDSKQQIAKHRFAKALVALNQFLLCFFIWNSCIRENSSSMASKNFKKIEILASLDEMSK